MECRSVSSLKRACSKKGLSASGTKADLVKRLRSRDNLLPVTTSDEAQIDCVITIPVCYSNPSNTIQMARMELQNASRNEDIQEYHLPDRTVIANPRGRFTAEMAARCEQMIARSDELQKEIGQLQTKVGRLERETKERERETNEFHKQLDRKTDLLYRKTEELERMTLGFRDLRHRFISTYKRDILNEADDRDRLLIRGGNVFAHSGNCKRDAELYSGMGARQDPLIFRKLYGVYPAIATTIDYISTIMVLDKYATIVADPKCQTSGVFHLAFKDFITALDEQGYPDNYLETGSGPVNEYWAFWKAVKDEVEVGVD